MTQKQFLRSLSHKLRGVPALEREEALVVAGYGLLLISVGVLLIIGTAALWRLCVRGAAALLRRKGAEDA